MMVAIISYSVVPLFSGVSHLIDNIIQSKPIRLIHCYIFDSSYLWLPLSHFSICHLKLLRRNILGRWILWLCLIKVTRSGSSIWICKSRVANLLYIYCVIYLFISLYKRHHYLLSSKWIHDSSISILNVWNTFWLTLRISSILTGNFLLFTYFLSISCLFIETIEL